MFFLLSKEPITVDEAEPGNGNRTMPIPYRLWRSWVPVRPPESHLPTTRSFPSVTGKSLFVGDWSRGRILAVHLQPEGSSYQGTPKEIVSGIPLPVTDLLMHPQDGKLYFLLGGRGTTSGLYRLAWVGAENAVEPMTKTSEPSPQTSTKAFRELRRRLTSLYHANNHQQAVRQIWPHLSHKDRTIRHVARIALELQPREYWQQRAFTEEIPRARLMALLALARFDEPRLLPRIVKSLTELEWTTLTQNERLTWLRCLEVAFARAGKPDLVKDVRDQALSYLEPLFPSDNPRVDATLCQLLVFLDSPQVPRIAVPLIENAVTSQQKLSYAQVLRHQQSGWPLELGTRYFQFLNEALGWRGGLSLTKYIERMGEDALKQIPSENQEPFASMLKRSTAEESAPATQRPFVREWKLADLKSVDGIAIQIGDEKTGRKLFAEVRCFACHRFQNEGGGVGPDLTTVVKRMTLRDLLESIVEPDRVISDQFAATTILTTEGQIVTGRVVNLVEGAWLIQEDMLDPAKLRRIPRNKIEEMRPAKTSMMPSGLLNTLTREDILDLLAFSRSGVQKSR